jgi:ubiquinone/menaquinone biosynthesis C-methylase UbiE
MNIDIETFYNLMADEFDKTRVRLWGCVKTYLDSFKSNSFILDVGCGNGKYMSYRSDLIIKGVDISIELVKICRNKGFDVCQGNMTNLYQFDDNTFDGLLAVASYHHLDNEEDRKKALEEMYRVLKIGGRCFIEVWAKEQTTNDNKHTSQFTNNNNLVKWTSSKTGEVYYRYYNIYSNNELLEEVIKLKPEFKVIEYGFEKGNYYIILEKNEI